MQGILSGKVREKLEAEQLALLEESVMPFGFIEGNFEEQKYEKMGDENWIIDKRFSTDYLH